MESEVSCRRLGQIRWTFKSKWNRPASGEKIALKREAARLQIDEMTAEIG